MGVGLSYLHSENQDMSKIKPQKFFKIQITIHMFSVRWEMIILSFIHVILIISLEIWQYHSVMQFRKKKKIY